MEGGNQWEKRREFCPVHGPPAALAAYQKYKPTPTPTALQ